MAVKCVGCLTWMLEGKYCRACKEANAGKTPCARPECNRWFWRLDTRRKYCNVTCEQIAAREARRRRIEAERNADPVNIEAPEPDDLLDNPATDTIACTTCKYGAPSKYADSGWECLDHCFLSCKPYTIEPLHWIQRDR